MTAPSSSGEPVRTANALPSASASSPDGVPSIPTSTGRGDSIMAGTSHHPRHATSADATRAHRSPPRDATGSGPMAARRRSDSIDATDPCPGKAATMAATGEDPAKAPGGSGHTADSAENYGASRGTPTVRNGPRLREDSF